MRWMVLILIDPCFVPSFQGRNERVIMTNLNRRGFLMAAASASVLKGLPKIASAPGGRRVLTLVYDKSLGMMRAIDRVVP